MTESYYIHINLNKEQSIDYLQGIISNILKSSIIETKTLSWIYDKAVDCSIEQDKIPDFLSYYNQLRFNYTGNDYGVPANVFAEFYSQALNNNCKQFCLSGFNKPGSYFMNMHYKTITELLFTELSRQNLLVNVIYTFDSIYQTPELFQIVNKLESETGIVGIVT
ncbi:hypothetical protein [Hymenobacter tenuis]